MEKDRINDTEKSFLSGKKRMDKLKVLMKYAGISVFEYFPVCDRMVLYNEQLEEEKGIMHFSVSWVRYVRSIRKMCRRCVSFFSDRLWERWN